MQTDQIEAIDRRLQEWASWLTAGKQSGAGFPAKNVLHASWTPPTRGAVPVMMASTPSTQRERATHAAVMRLGIRLQNTLVVVYVQRVPVAEQALRLECQPSTVRARVQQARQMLHAMWCER